MRKYHWLCLLAVIMVGCTPQKAESAGRDAGKFHAGRIQHPAIQESSGVVASRAQTNVFWTHTDGSRVTLVAMKRNGEAIDEFRVVGARLEDWEDIAADGKGNLFIADTGNNELRRRALLIHQIKEPVAGSRSGAVEINRTWNLQFPQGPADCESLFVWKDHGYVISKVGNDARAGLFRFALTNAGPQKLESLGHLNIDSPVTGADISPNGALLGVVAKNGAYVFRINGDPAAAVSGKKPYHVKFRDLQIEGCTFVPDGLLATAETREILLFGGPEFTP